MRINPDISASAISRYNHVVRQQQAPSRIENPQDKVEISERAKLYTSLIQAAEHSDDVSETKVHAVMNRIASGAYDLNMDQLADRMLGLDGDE